MENYSLSDIAAVSDGNGFGGGNSAWVLIILFALIFGWGGNGFGNRTGEFGAYATAASQQEILFGQQFQNLDNKLDRLGNGIADATYALNNAVTTEGRSIQTQIANCCCENQKNVDSVRYDMAMNTQKVLDAISTNKIESLQGQINQLQLQNALCGVVRYPNSMAYNAGTSPFCGCGCNNGYGYNV